MGRIVYAVLEHAFSQRAGDEQRCVMAFKPSVAPFKVGIYRLINHQPFDPIIEEMRKTLQAQNIATRVDSSSGSVGRRYARADELGIPFGITVDFQTLIDQSVTVRDRDSMAQIRVPQRSLYQLIAQLTSEEITFEQAMNRFMVVKHPGEDDEDDEEEGEAKKKQAEESKGKKSTSSVTIQATPRGCFSRPNFDA